MNIGESISLALGSVRANKLRAGLTLLSIAIGVFAIVGVAAAVRALNAKIDDQLSSLGRNSFFITKMPVMQMGNMGHRYMNRKDISLRQAMELKSRLTSAEFVGVMYQAGNITVKYLEEKTDPNVGLFGSDEVYLVNGDYTVSEGRGLDAQDVQTASDIVVLGADVVNRLFKNASAVGKVVLINNRRFTVVGTLKAKGAIFGQSQDNFVIIPVTSASKYFFDEWHTTMMLFIRSKTSDDLQDVVDQATGLMRMIRRVPLGEENDFEVSTNESISDTFGGFTKYLSMFGLLCGSLALAAAGVGIMNIMLVSVKERTREIGIRKALGATKGNILIQFMIEAVTICLVGAIIGALLGIGFGALIGVIMESRPQIPTEWLAVALAACAFIGIVFGSYPAYRASRLDPIDALRYE